MLEPTINKSFNHPETSSKTPLSPNSYQEKLFVHHLQDPKPVKTAFRQSSMYKRWIAEGTLDSNHRYVLIQRYREERSKELAEELIKKYNLPEYIRALPASPKGKSKVIVYWTSKKFQEDASSLLEKYLPEYGYGKITLLKVTAELGVTNFNYSFERQKAPQLIIEYLDSGGSKYRATIEIASQKVCIQPI